MDDNRPSDDAPGIGHNSRQVDPAIDYGELPAETVRQIEAKALQIDKLLERRDDAAYDIGGRLLEIKKVIPTKKWGGYLKARFRWTKRTAFNFTSAAQLVDEEEKFASFKSSVLYRLAAPSCPKAVRARFLALIDNGRDPKTISVREVADEIANAKASGKPGASPARSTKRAKTTSATEPAVGRINGKPSPSASRPQSVTSEDGNADANAGDTNDDQTVTGTCKSCTRQWATR
jgi:hypothetical protein